MWKNPNLFIILLVYMSLFGLGLTDNLRGTLLPEILKVFSLNNAQGAYLFITTSIFSIASSSFSHFWIQKISCLSLWRWGVFFMGLGSIGFFLAPQFTPALFACAALGVGFGILAVTQNLLITEVAQPEFKKKSLSGLHSMYGFASLFAPLLVTQFTQQGISWRYLFLIAGVLIFLLYLSSLSAPSVLIHTLTVSNIPPPSPMSSSKSGNQFFSLRPEHTFSLLVASYVSMELLISTRLTSYLKFYHHWSLTQASLYLSYFFMALLLGRMIFTFFHPPFSTKKMLFISIIGSLFMLLLGLQIHPLFLCLSGLFLAPFYPLAISLLSEYFPQKISSVMSTTISLQSLLFILMNLSVGYWADRWGIASAMHSVFIFGGMTWFLLTKLH